MRLFAVLPVLIFLGACQMNSATPAGYAPADEQADPTTSLAQDFEVAARTSDAQGEKKGLFAFLKPTPPPSALAGSDIEVVESTGTDQTATTGQTPGLFAFLTGPKTVTPASPESGVVEAAMPTDTPQTNSAPQTPRQPRRGLFGLGGGGAASTATVQPGEVLPFGEVGLACGFKTSDLGKQVDSFPHDGRAVWKLYDTNPLATGPRTQFITGFSDGCPRQVTAALVVFGSAAVHQVHRYGKPMASTRWSAADNAYEEIKSSVCGVARKQPCGDAKLAALDKRLAFLSIYPRFGGNEGWLELLLDQGRLVSKQIR
ncbi:hypothetical protein [Celeribacter arenosi]|uniref:Lipoprotein n=1 Tax=Celeribacter arenosi TaxID=792649 RepID=A0ABP7K2T0_9RHOB